MVQQIVLSTLAFWAALRWPVEEATLLQPVFSGSGMILLLQTLVGYSGGVPLSTQSIFGGCVMSSMLVVASRFWFSPRPGSIVMLGNRSLRSSNLFVNEPRLSGALEDDPARLPPQLPYLGPLRDFPNLLTHHRPARVVINYPDWQSAVSPRLLLDFKLQGGVVEAARRAHRRLFDCIPIETLRPEEVLLSESFSPNKRVMALQAVYSDLIGLALLVLLGPVIVALAIASRVAAGPGPVLERVECSGFQGIPFLLRSFRTRHYSTGRKTGIGAMIEALHLVHFPGIVNVVRGEMNLLGPAPVRSIFSVYMESVCPLYSLRLSIKPGLLGWAQSNLSASLLPEETQRLAYDLYYLEQLSPGFDAEVCLCMLPGLRPRSQRDIPVMRPL